MNSLISSLVVQLYGIIMKMVCHRCDEIQGFPPDAKPDRCPTCGSPYDG